jgi:hypothetical protein
MGAARDARYHDPDARYHDPIESDELLDREVPAAVVCAVCGNAECPGCVNDPSRSGVVALVAWERPGTSAARRLWATARATTLDADHFFESLSDGPLNTALTFAVAAELVASSAMALVFLALVAALAPDWLRQTVSLRWPLLLRLFGAGVPLVACFLVGAHVAHGYALHLGARAARVRDGGRRALRFGLYAAGWDLVIGPIGALVLAVREGPRAALSIVRLATGLPTRSAKAFLRGTYRLANEAARPALRASNVVAVLVTLLSAIFVIAAIGWAAFL